MKAHTYNDRTITESHIFPVFTDEGQEKSPCGVESNKSYSTFPVFPLSADRICIGSTSEKKVSINMLHYAENNIKNLKANFQGKCSFCDDSHHRQMWSGVWSEIKGS